MRDDYDISADLCEEHGLVEPARVLRAIARGTGEVFMVRIDVDNRDFGVLSGPASDALDRTRPLFRTRDEAEAYADRLRVALLREYSIPPEEWEYFTRIPILEFCRQVSTILGVDFPSHGDVTDPLLPGWASDEQLRQVVPLLEDQFVEVVSLPFKPADDE